MKKDLNNIPPPDPEQFWNQAEKMLDQHFMQKRRKKRFAIFFVTLIGLIGSVYLFTNNTPIATKNNIVRTDTKENNSKPLKTRSDEYENAAINSQSKPEVTQKLSKNLKSEKLAQEKTESIRTRKNTEPAISNTNNSTITTRNPDNIENDFTPADNAKSSAMIKKSGTLDKSPTPKLNEPINTNYSDDLAINNNQATKKLDEPESSTIEYLLASKNTLIETTTNNQNLLNPQPLNTSEIPKTGTKSKLALSFYASAHSVSKTLKASEATHYLERREQEEKNIIAPAMGISLLWMKNNFSAGLGVEYSYLGEKIAYGSYSRQAQYTQYGNWETFNRLVTDTDTAYISGLRWFLETQVIRLDSAYISTTDTSFVNVHDKSLGEHNGTNKFYYVEIPLQLRYQFPVKRFAFGISVGISPAWLTSEKGYYIKEDQSGLEQVSVTKPVKAFFVNGSLGLDISYHLKPGINLFVGPEFKTNLGTITNTDFSVSQRYTKVGVKLGVVYQIR